jgi:deoxyribodipyrimidine photo-lyase
LLNSPEATLKSNGQPYSIFTPYFRNASRLAIAHPKSNSHENYFKSKIDFSHSKALYKKILPHPEKLALVGGRTEALKILNEIKGFKYYEASRDIPGAKNGTTLLSPYLKFTVCSPREVYATICAQLGKPHELIRSLYWRDFFSMIAFFAPHIFEGPFHKKFEQLKWNEDSTTFNKWCKGQTGFPIVDAGMRQMNVTGYMHNRVRMIVACFLVKDLRINWRKGERYFAQTLIDYDPALNNGNWQWCASTGADAQPYFRIFNPWTQQKKFDPDCLYIKQWIPELSEFAPKIIHKWDVKGAEQSSSYPLPIVNHEEESRLTLDWYRKVTRRSLDL